MDASGIGPITSVSPFTMVSQPQFDPVAIIALASGGGDGKQGGAANFADGVVITHSSGSFSGSSGSSGRNVSAFA